MERTDRLRRVPNTIRYVYFAISKAKKTHTGLTHGGLALTHKKHGIESLWFIDLVDEKVTEVTDVKKFLDIWRAHYNDPKWSYAEEVKFDGKRWF